MPRTLRRLQLAYAILTVGSVALPAQSGDQSLQVRVPPQLQERFQAPPGIQWGFFRNNDDARIRYSHTPAVGPKVKGTVVLMHGFSEFAEKYFEVMRDLTAHGYDVWQMDWHGYGGSDRYLADREKAYSRGAERDTRDLEQFVRTVVKGTPGVPLILVAHSMGAQLAIRYLHDYPGRFQAAALSAPFLSLGSGAGRGMPGWMVNAVIWSTNRFGFSEQWAMGNGPWRDRVVDKLTHDPARAELQRQWSRASPVLRIGGVTNGWLREYVGSLDEINRPEYFAAIKVPILLGSAGDDVLTRPEVQATACSQMPHCRLARIDHGWHELFMEADPIRSQWMSEVFSFVEQQRR